MDPDRIDHPSNAVVMSDFLHMEFKGFRFVFEATVRTARSNFDNLYLPR